MLCNLGRRTGTSLSEINLGQEMQALDLGRKLDAFTGVRLYAGRDANGEDITYTVGTTDNLLEVNVPNGTREMAQAILDGLTLRGYQYQPFESANTYTDPAIEIGDSVSANGTSGIVLSKEMTHSRLMASDLSAPYDEEVDHEFRFESRATREYKRESKYTRSRLSINANAIEAEVARASATEGTLYSKITMNADNITAKVSKTSSHGSGSSLFGWTLTDTSWDLFSGSNTVLHATNEGIEISGKITATSGFIGTESSGFEIGSNYIRNGMQSLTDTEHNGVYIATSGIALGKGAFKATNAGRVVASNIEITGGSISIKDANDNVAFYVSSTGNLTAETGTFKGNVYAGNINYGQGSGGVDYGYLSGLGITASSLTTTQCSSGIVGDLALGHAYGLACDYGTANYPGNFSCGTLWVKYEIHYTDPNYTTHGVRWRSTTFTDGGGNTVSLTYLGSDDY